MEVDVENYKPNRSYYKIKFSKDEARNIITNVQMKIKQA